MEKMKMKAYFIGGRKGKDGKTYGEFQFIGGSFTCVISSELHEEFRKHLEKEILIEVSLKAQGISQYDRSATVFVPVDVALVSGSAPADQGKSKLV